VSDAADGADGVLARLAATLDTRRGADPASSYAASLFDRGPDTMLKKVGEEAVEFILAGKDDDDAHLVAEAADVWFHMLVLLSYRGLGPDDILGELARREGLSGHAEKASRDVQPRDAVPADAHVDAPGDVTRGESTA